MPMRFDVFLCHNSADKPAVQEIEVRLRGAGLEAWLDRADLQRGVEWSAAVEKALTQECASCAVFIGPNGLGPWQERELRLALDRQVAVRNAGLFPVIPVLLPGGEAQTIPPFLRGHTYIAFQKTLDDPVVLDDLVRSIRGQSPARASAQIGECPYRGLHCFDVDDARFFFGREALTARLLESLRAVTHNPSAVRFLAVVGASGSGKSSLLRAGLIASIRKGMIGANSAPLTLQPRTDASLTLQPRTEGNAWPCVICRPGPQPLESLATELARTCTLPQGMTAFDLIRQMGTDASALHVAGRLVLPPSNPEARLVVAIDQFEELFTVCEDEDVRGQFIDNLLHAARTPQGPVLVLLAMRADFYGKCAAYPELARVLSRQQELIGAMTEEELRAAIEKPAQSVGCEFEPGLVDLLLHDILNQPGSLPLLQHALLELWQQKDVRRLTAKAYHEIGGVAGALQRRAESVYERLSERKKDICRRIFLRLTQPGEGTEDTKRRVSLQELKPVEGPASEVEAVIHNLSEADTRLVTAEAGERLQGERFIEVAHEALIRAWPRLREWIAADRAALVMQHRLTEAARQWREKKRDRSFLYRGSRLEETLKWAAAHRNELNPLESDFLKASRRQEQLNRYWGLALILGLVFFVGSGVAALSVMHINEQRDELKKQAAKLEETGKKQQQEAERLKQEAAEKQRQMDAQYPADIRLADQEFQANRLFRMRDLLLRHEKSEHLKHFEWHYLWQLCQARLLLGPRHKLSVRGMAFSPDGTQAVTGGHDGVVHLWDTSSGRLLRKLTERGEPLFFGVAYRPDGKAVAAVSADAATAWDVDSGELIYRVDAVGRVCSIAFSPDGKELAVGGTDNRVWIANAFNGKLVRTCYAPSPNLPGQAQGKEHSSLVNGLAYSADSKWLASAQSDGAVLLWDVHGADTEITQPLRTFRAKEGQATCVAISPDGKWLVSGHESTNAVLWNLKTGKKVREFTEHILIITAVGFSPDARWVATVSGDGTARLHDLISDKPGAVLYGPGGVLYGGVFSFDGTRLGLCADDGQVQVWDLTVDDRAQEVVCSSKDRQSGYYLAQSPDGSLLAQGGGNGEVYLWDPRTGKRTGTFQGHDENQPVQGVAFSPDGQWLLSASEDATARIWEVASGKVLRTFREHRQRIYPAVYDPLGRFVATGDAAGFIVVWDPRTALGLKTLTHSIGKEVLGLAISANGARLASVGVGGELVLWDTATWETVWRYAGERWRAGLYGVAYCPDNDRVALAWNDGTVEIVSEKTRGTVATFSAHNSRCMGLAFTSDGRRLASGGVDEVARLWDLDAGEQLLLTLRSGCLAMVFDAANRRLATNTRPFIDIWYASAAPGSAGPLPERWLGWARAQSIECEKAKHWFGLYFHTTRLLGADPSREAVYRNVRAEADYRLHDYQQAVNDLTEVLKLSKVPNQTLAEPIARTYRRRGDSYFSLRQYEQAEADLTQSLTLDAKDPLAWSIRGETRSRLGKWQDAIADYDASLELNDKPAVVYQLRGDAYAELSKFDQAVADYRAALKRSPSDRRSLANLAVADLARGDVPAYRRACVNMFERLLVSASTDADDWNTVAWVCSLQADGWVKSDELVSVIDKAVLAQPNEYAILNTRGAVLYRAGRFPEAVKQLQESIALHGKGGGFEDWVFLAMAQFQTRQQEAAASLDKASKLYNQRLGPGANVHPPASWFIRVEWQLLLQEAEKLIGKTK